MAKSFPFWDPDGSLEAIQRQKLLEMDIESGLHAKKLWKELEYWHHVRCLGISGLIMSVTHRSYFIEYFDRLVHHGPDSFPTSARLGISFLKYDKKYWVFDNLPEFEHLLTTDDYFAWYARSDMPNEPSVLQTAIPEGVVHSYNMTHEFGGHRLRSKDSELVIAGVSFVRRSHELTCMLVAGENPPFPTDKDAIKSLEGIGDVPGKEWVEPSPLLSVKDRYLPGMKGYGRVILITRFNLAQNKYDVRYLFRDIGQGYLTASDNPIEHTIIRELSSRDHQGYLERMREDLARYDVLFSAMASLIYLPLMFITEIDRVEETRFGTELLAHQSDDRTKEAIRLFGDDAKRFYRTIKCLASNNAILANEQSVMPPEMEFQATGYWLDLPPGSIGEDQDGTPIVGKTWVERKESWFAHDPKTFLIRRNVNRITGPDPGIVYITRSPSHEVDLYKVGLTRRPVEQRNRELSSATGVPLPFGVCASWEVGDCAVVEREVHRHLEWCRVNARREFFNTSLSRIVETVERVISDLGNTVRDE